MINEGIILSLNQILGITKMSNKKEYKTDIRDTVLRDAELMKETEKLLLARESEAISTIENLVNTKLERQFYIAPYFIDGYDSVNKIAYEVIEPGELSLNDLKTRQEREQYISRALGCTFIRLQL